MSLPIPCGARKAERSALETAEGPTAAEAPRCAEATRADAAACRHCAPRFAATATAHEPRPIFQGSASARLLIASQAPGLRAHLSGRPFDDPSGVRLRTWMGIDGATFWDPARVAILPMAFCFPGYSAKRADLPPPPDCARLWRARMLALFPSVELTLSIGQYSLAWHLGARRGASLGETMAAWREHAAAGVLPLPHPSWRNNAWLARHPWVEAEVMPWLRAAVARLV